MIERLLTCARQEVQVARAKQHPNAHLGVAYTRLSGLPYGYDPFSPDNQRRICSEAAERDGVTIVAEYTDLAKSGRKNIKRPGFEGAMQELLESSVGNLYVAKLDRLSRRGMGHVGSLLDNLEEVGGRIKFVADGLDTEQPGSRQIIAILAEQARAEADATSWRLTQWHAHNRRHGLWKRKRTFGYEVVNGKLRPHPVESKIVRGMVDDFLDGASLRSIAMRLNREGVRAAGIVAYEEALAKGRPAKKPRTETWSYITVRAILTAPSLAALASHHDRLVDDENGDLIYVGDGIVTVVERGRILAELERRTALVSNSESASRIGTRTGGGRPPKYLLTGFARCGECGGAAARNDSAKGGIYYRCARKSRAEVCRGGSVPGEYLEKEVRRRVAGKLAALEPGDLLLDKISEQWLTRAIPEEEADRRTLGKALAAVDRRIQDLYDDRYQRGLFETSEEISEWERMIRSARAQRKAIKEKIDSLGPVQQPNIGALLDAELTEEAWPKLPVSRQRDLLGLAVQAVWIYSADVPLQNRIRVIYHDEELPEPRQGTIRPDDGRLAVATLYRGNSASSSVRRHTVHRSACTILPYWPDDAQSEAAYHGSTTVLFTEPGDLPRLTDENPVRICGRCQPELPEQIAKMLRAEDDSGGRHLPDQG